ncbi:hypothetical protein ACFVAQ_13350 [Streptomyces sp. NPDC057651]|uniref:hypothetical protein n=1 Tax=Streptomyces sp. NPDC057651 TaxID=3346194 RepID=UPI0036CC6DA7
MSRIIADISVPLDEVLTGPDPSPGDALGTGGEAPQLRSVISASIASHLTYDVSR